MIAVYGEQGPCVVGWLARCELELVGVLHFGEGLRRSLFYLDFLVYGWCRVSPATVVAPAAGVLWPVRVREVLSSARRGPR